MLRFFSTIIFAGFLAVAGAQALTSGLGSIAQAKEARHAAIN